MHIPFTQRQVALAAVAALATAALSVSTDPVQAQSRVGINPGAVAGK